MCLTLKFKNQRPQYQNPAALFQNRNSENNENNCFSSNNNGLPNSLKVTI